jgi:hypothetical protein
MKDQLVWNQDLLGLCCRKAGTTFSTVLEMLELKIKY